MEATVIRNGSHQGEKFVEVEHRPDGKHASPLHYAVPVSEEIPLGSTVEISVTLKDLPKEPEEEEAPAVSKSPVAVENKLTAPSGQTQLKQGSLPKSFPHFAELEAAGITTYAGVRKLNGDYKDVAGIGPAKGKEIDEALS